VELKPGQKAKLAFVASNSGSEIARINVHPNATIAQNGPGGTVCVLHPNVSHLVTDHIPEFTQPFAVSVTGPHNTSVSLSFTSEQNLVVHQRSGKRTAQEANVPSEKAAVATPQKKVQQDKSEPATPAQPAGSTQQPETPKPAQTPAPKDKTQKQSKKEAEAKKEEKPAAAAVPATPEPAAAAPETGAPAKQGKTKAGKEDKNAAKEQPKETKPENAQKEPEKKSSSKPASGESKQEETKQEAKQEAKQETKQESQEESKADAKGKKAAKQGQVERDNTPGWDAIHEDSTGLVFRNTQPPVIRGKQAVKGSRISIRYQGILSSGVTFDSNMPRGKPLSFFVGKGDVITGLEIGVMGMRAGDSRRIVIPPALAYGEMGHPPLIPPNETLIFDIDCLVVE